MNKDVLIEKLKRENYQHEREIAELKNRVNEKDFEMQNLRTSLAFRFAEKLSVINQKFGNGIVLHSMRKIKHLCNSNSALSKIVEKGNKTTKKYDNILSLNEFEFYHFKENREDVYHINLTEVMSPCVKGLVSIVLPVYNGGDLLIKSIDSVLMQTYSNFEFIIVDDGSTDNTPKIIDEYALKDSRIRVIHKENEKLPKTLSRGFREARGEFFTWTSADNIMEDDCIEVMVSELNDFPDVGMVFANIRLINELDDPIVTNKWYADKYCPEHVLLPHCMLELNTYANNYIGAAFMYRAHVAHVLEDYSAMKYCTEDYDYWMRTNSLFLLRHICSQKPIYNYRFHSQSLTSRDRELKISENRYRLMLLDDFRREYYLKPMVWLLEGEDSELRSNIKTELLNTGHRVINRQESILYCDSLYERVIYLQFGNPDISDKSGEYGYRIYIGGVHDEVDYADWDCLISQDEVSSENFLESHKGWFFFLSSQTMIAFIDAKVKNSFLYEMEKVIESEGEFTKKISIVTACGSGIENLRNVLLSLEKQSKHSDLFEVVVAAKADDLIWINTVINILKDQGMIIPIRLIVSSTNNIVDSYNNAIWAATGEIISILDCSCICGEDYVEKVIHSFGLYDDISGVVVRTGKSKRIGNLIFKAEELKMVGGFARSFKYNETDTWTGWEDYIILKLMNHGRKIIESEHILIIPSNNNFMGKVDIEESLLIDYYKELRQLKPYNTWPEDLNNKISMLSSSLTDTRDDDDIIGKINGLKAVLNKVTDDFTIRSNKEFIRRIYSYQYREDNNKLSILAEKGLLVENDILVSVIVPIYKVQDYLKRCVDSILKQTVTNIEVLLVDDGSPDECPDMCDEYAQKDKRVKVIHKLNGGLSDARNAGLDVARGKYISFIDSDDWIEPNMLEELCYAAVIFNADIAECDFCNVYKDKVVNEMGNTGCYYTATSLDAQKYQMDWSYFKCVAWNKIYNSSLFMDGKRYPKGKYHEDEFFTYLVTYEAKKLVYVDKVLYNYDKTREGSITGKKFSVNGLDAVEAWRNKAQFYKKLNLSELYLQALDLYVWIALNRLDLCTKEHISGNRVDEIKKWLMEDYEIFVESGINEQLLSSVKKYIG